MLFVEFRFVIFFLIIMGVYWALRGNTSRKVWLLGVSHFFYACFFIWRPGTFELADFWSALTHGDWAKMPRGWWFPALLIGSTVWDYLVGLGISKAPDHRGKKLWVISSICVNLGVLGFFKYFNFFQENVFAICDAMGLDPFWKTYTVFLPYGISFYTFQSLSYSIEVYRGKLPAVRNFLDLAFFVAFFPQVVAGPIVRAMTFLPQLTTPRRWADVDVRGALTLFFIGFVKKACISENVAPIVDQFFAEPDKFNLYSSWIGVIFYAVQIYCDFSGYTDMATACARLLGFELTLNFNFPYFANSVTEFWRRWHVSLSTWLRDYLYIPLGGNRGTTAFIYRNLMLTMVLGGLWHGASWNFVLWGALHGIALIAHREWSRLTENSGAVLKRTMVFLGPVLCFYWILITWVPFRATDTYEDSAKKTTLLWSADGFQDARTHDMVHPAKTLTRDDKAKQWIVRDAKGAEVTRIAKKNSGLDITRTVLDSLVLFDSHGKRSFTHWCLWFLLGLGGVHWLCSRGVLSTWWRRIPAPAYAALLGAGLAIALFFMPTKYKAFIYFQF